MGTSTVKYKCLGCKKQFLPVEPEAGLDGAMLATCTHCGYKNVITRKEIQSRVGRSSRAKGANFERKIAKQLSKWWPGGHEFKRTPGSGGSQLKVGFDMAGDICTTAPDFKYHLELKNSSGSWDGLDQALSNNAFALWKWLEQARRNYPAHRVPMVIFTRVGRPTYCAAPNKLINEKDVFTRIMDSNLSYMMLLVKHFNEPVYVWLFDDMLASDPKIWM